MFAVPANWVLFRTESAENTGVFELRSNWVVIHHEGHEDT